MNDFLLLDSNELLSQRGWIKTTQLNGKDVVASYKSGEITWCNIDSIKAAGYSGEIVDFKNQHLDFSFIANQLILAKRRWHTDFSKINLIELSKWDNSILVPVSGLEKSHGVKLTDAEVRFIGYLLSDGHLSKQNNQVVITQSLRYPNVISDIEKTLNECGFKFGKILQKRKGEESKYFDIYHFTISKGKPRSKELDKRGWEDLSNYVAGCKEWLDVYDSFNEHQTDILLQSINYADGRKSDRGYVEKTYTIAAGNKKDYADRLQSLCIRRNYRCNMVERCQHGRVQYILYIKKLNYSTIAGQNIKDSIVRNKPCVRPHLTAHISNENMWRIVGNFYSLITRKNGKVVIV